MICPRCYRANSPEVTICANCGSDMTAALASEKSAVWDEQSLKEVASKQKDLIWIILLSIFTSFIPYATLLSGIISAFFIYRLARAMRHEAAWVYIILSFIPVVCLFALVRLNNSATKILRQGGFSVGLLGANTK